MLIFFAQFDLFLNAVRHKEMHGNISIRFTELQNDRNANDLCFEQQLIMEMQLNPHIVVTVSLDAGGHAGGLTIWRKGIHHI